MKRKAEPTGGTAAVEAEVSRELRVAGQEEEHASNFLSSLPDLALRAVLDFLQQQQQEQEQEATTTLKDDDSKRSGSLPALWHLRTRHRAFVDHAEFLHQYDEQSMEPSLEEWTAYKNELAARPNPPAHTSFEELMESDAPGRWASPSLLALRLTCRSVKCAVEAVARRGLFPQFELFTSVDRWLTSRVAWPTLLVASSPEEARHQHSIRELESAAIACANARIHQLRLDAYMDQPFGETSECRASLAQTLNWGAEEAPDDGRARLRVEYMTYAGDFLGCEAGMGLESCLSLSLPGQPHEVLRILCSAAARSDRNEELTEVYLDLHTNSPAWAKALGLVPAEQQTSFAAAGGATSLTGITKPLLTWQADHLLASNADDKLLGGIWRALGFTTAARGGPAGDGDGDGKEKAAAGVVWDRVWVEMALLAGLGWVWPFWEPRHYRHLPTTAQDGRQPCVTKWLRQAERFLQRKAVLDEANGFFVDHVDPLLAQLERRPQKLRGLRHVRRAIGQFFGQRRIALVGPALERLRKIRAATTPDPVRSGRQVAESTPTFVRALRFVEGRSISTEMMDDQQHPFTSSSVRWAVRLRPGATANTTTDGHGDDGGDDGDGNGGDHNGNDDDQPRSGKRRRVGPEVGEISSSAPIDVDSDSDDSDDEARRSAGGRLVFTYDRKISVRFESSPNAWHERLAVRAVVPDHHQQQKLEGLLGAGEEHELYVSRCIDDADPREVMAYATLAGIGRLLGLLPTATTTASSLPTEEEDEEERFGEEVANLLVMVAKVAMWDAHVTLPRPCAINQELADHLDCIAEADHHVADSADQPPPPLPAASATVPSPAAAADIAAMAAGPLSSSAALVTASVQFVEAYMREPWPAS